MTKHRWKPFKSVEAKYDAFQCEHCKQYLVSIPGYIPKNDDYWCCDPLSVGDEWPEGSGERVTFIDWFDGKFGTLDKDGNSKTMELPSSALGLPNNGNPHYP